MAKSIRETIDVWGVPAVAEASGIPFWTLRKWRDRDRIPGAGIAQEMRLRAVMAGIAKLEANGRRRKKARASQAA